MFINARSGSASERGLTALQETIDAALAGQAALSIEPLGPEDMGRRLAELDPAGGPVWIGGGDGTIRAAAEHLAAGGPPLGILPLGTMNLLARDLGLPEDPAEAVLRLLHGEERQIDLARLNDHAFLCAAVAGVVPELAELRERTRGAEGMLATVRAALNHLREMSRLGFEPRHFILTPEHGPARTVEALAVVIVNNRFAESPAFGQPMRRDRLDTGLLSAYLIVPENGADILRLVGKIVRGAWVVDPCIERLEDTGFSMQIGEGDDALLSLDGEPMAMAMPLSFRLDARRLPVVAPPAAEDAVHG